MKKPTAPIKIVFFDIDYTLYIKDEARIPTSITEQVLPRLKAKGIIPAIATGRNYDGFPEALKPLMNENGFELFVTINGQDNLYQGKQISDYRLSIQRIQQAVEKLEKLG
ncbi:HAD hydrolase family protein, partial [Haemophilus paraphrohaemolyticus]